MFFFPQTSHENNENNEQNKSERERQNKQPTAGSVPIHFWRTDQNLFSPTNGRENSSSVYGMTRLGQLYISCNRSYFFWNCWYWKCGKLEETLKRCFHPTMLPFPCEWGSKVKRGFKELKIFSFFSSGFKHYVETRCLEGSPNTPVLCFPVHNMYNMWRFLATLVALHFTPVSIQSVVVSD